MVRTRKMHGSLAMGIVIAALSSTLVSCSSGGGSGTKPAGEVSISGTVQPDPEDPTASGQNAGATVYVVGQQNNPATTDENGNFTLTIDPTISGVVLAARSFSGKIQKADTTTRSFGLVVVSDALSHGRKTELSMTDGVPDPIPTIYINTVGSISGKAFLQNAPNGDHSGILVYIPGTSFMATTAADGSYTISNVPSGKYDYLRADKSGTVWHYAMVSAVTVTTNSRTTAPDMLLLADVGANGKILINDGALFATDPTVTLNIATSDNAVLMMISETGFFIDGQWRLVQSSIPHTFTASPSAGGVAEIYAKFSDPNGLESGITKATIYIDTDPRVSRLSPVSLVSTVKPTLVWSATQPIPDPRYHVQVSTNSDFTNVIENDTTLTQTQYSVKTTLANFGVYYWRVSIIDQAGKEWNWAGPWKFTVDSSTVTLTGPAMDALVNDTTPSFTWLVHAATDYYVLTLSNNPDLSGGIDYATTINLYTPPPLAATDSADYFWAVTHYDAGGFPGIRSDIWKFTLDTTPPTGGLITSSTHTGTTALGVMINDGNPFTTTTGTVVSLSLAAADVNGVAAYYAAEDPALPADPVWNILSAPAPVTYASTTLFTLSKSVGRKTVSVWFRDGAGNVSGPFSDSIDMIPSFILTDVEIGAASATVGLDSSLALDSSGNPYISYRYCDPSAVCSLKFASGSLSTWQTATLDSGGSTGGYSSLAIGPNNAAHIIYYNATSDNLKYAYGTPVSGPTTWTTGTLGYLGINAQAETSVAVDPSNNKPRISVFSQPNTLYGGDPGGISHGRYYSTATPWMYSGMSTGTGNSSLAIDSLGRSHIVYVDNSKNLVHAVVTLGSTNDVWSTETVTTVASSGGDPAIAIDAHDNVHISFYDFHNATLSGDLAYATNAGGPWVVTTIDAGGRRGQYSSIAVDADDFVHISYQSDETFNALKYATNAYGGDWGVMVVGSSTSGYGFYTSLAVNKSTGKIHISYMDQGQHSLKYATTE